MSEKEETKTGLEFSFKPVKKKPNRKYRKGSKYDPVIDEFLASTETLVTINIPDRDHNYIRTQLKKRLDARDLNDKIDISVVNNKCYLEKK